jgi:peptide deformylase
MRKVRVMAILEIIVAPDPRLKYKAKPVAIVNESVRKLMADMVETMHLAPGIGLASVQVGDLRRVIVVDVSDPNKDREPICMANPELVWTSDEEHFHEEGCLSLPEQYVEIKRPEAIRVRYLDETAEMRELEADGLLAICIQHEMDHLDGVLFVDYISSLKRGIILRKLAKVKKQELIKV